MNILSPKANEYNRHLFMNPSSSSENNPSELFLLTNTPEFDYVVICQDEAAPLVPVLESMELVKIRTEHEGQVHDFEIPTDSPAVFRKGSLQGNYAVLQYSHFFKEAKINVSLMAHVNLDTGRTELMSRSSIRVEGKTLACYSPVAVQLKALYKVHE